MNNTENDPAVGCALERRVMRTCGKSELSENERIEFDDTGCGEGYEWWLRHQGLLHGPAEEGRRDYPPIGDWLCHVDEYHRWMDA